MRNKNDFPFKPLVVPKKEIKPEPDERISDTTPDNAEKSNAKPRRMVVIVDRKLYHQDYDAIRKNLKASGKLFCDERVIHLI